MSSRFVDHVVFPSLTACCVCVCVCLCSNVKKFVNTMQRASKMLTIGDHFVSMATLDWLTTIYPVTDHGLHPTDITNSRNRQSVPPVERIMSEVRPLTRTIVGSALLFIPTVCLWL